MGIVLWIFLGLILLYAIIFRVAGGVVRGVFGFFRDFFEDTFEGMRYRRTLSQLGAFLVTVAIIVIVIRALQ